MTRLRAALAMDPGFVDQLFPPQTRERLERLVHLHPAVLHRDTGVEGSGVEGFGVEGFGVDANRAHLADLEILITGWGAPRLDAEVLDAMPALRAVLHSAGTVKEHLTDQVWQRGILVTSAADANAIPVAEYTLACILLVGRGAFPLAEAYRASRTWPDVATAGRLGTLGLRVGVVGASRVGRRLIRALHRYDVEILLHDPAIFGEEARRLGVRSVPLADLLTGSDVVTLHAPALPSTYHLLGASALSQMRDGATVINTARGTLVDHEALAAELARGRLRAVLDVTDPEPLPSDSPLWDLPGVLITPHVAGSSGTDLARLGAAVVEEVQRVLDGRPPIARVSLDSLQVVA